MPPELPERLRAWLWETVPRVRQVKPLVADAGFRRYYRVRLADGTDLVVADSPPALERNADFVQRGRALRRLGIRVPEIFAVDFSKGFMLMEDFGDETLAQRLVRHPEHHTRHLKQAFADMAQLHAHTGQLASGLMDSFDSARCLREMQLGGLWFAERLLGVPPPPAACLAYIADRLQGIPKVATHFDYHVRNIMVLPDNRHGLLDFQDLAHAPLGLDLASLLKDCYWHIEPPARQRWTQYYGGLLCEHGVLAPADLPMLSVWCDLAGLQRHCRILGVFSRILLRDARDNYIQYLPRVCTEIEQAADGDADIAPLAAWARRVGSPLARKMRELGVAPAD